MYAACRPATVTIKESKDGKELHTETLKIADPHFYQIVGLPPKGKVSTHSQCGVSVKSEKDTGISTNLAIFEKVLGEIKLTKEEIDKIKKDKNN